MILPDKHITLQFSLLNAGALVLEELAKPQSVPALWEKVATRPEIGSFERFGMTMAFLYSIGGIELESGVVIRKDRFTDHGISS